jgi:acyl dehydratase
LIAAIAQGPSEPTHKVGGLFVPIFYPDILEQKTAARTFTYGDKDVMLYALGIGLGRDPMNETELEFVYEKGLKVVPTAATVLASAGGRPARGADQVEQKPGHRPSVINYLMVVHGEQKVELHRPLPTSGTFTAQGRTVGAFDKGKDKGAVIINETVWTDEAGEKVATLTGSTFARGDGGFGGPSEGQPEPHEVPSRKPDLSVDIATREDQALLYRLNGDRNPLHSDPESARRSGFPRPILHGLCTYGITCRAVLQAITGYDPDQIASHQARFSAPVFPGDTITVDLWKDGQVISFEARVKDRNATVIKNGKTMLRA